MLVQQRGDSGTLVKQVMVEQVTMAGSESPALRAVGRSLGGAGPGAGRQKLTPQYLICFWAAALGLAFPSSFPVVRCVPLLASSRSLDAHTVPQRTRRRSPVLRRRRPGFRRWV